MGIVKTGSKKQAKVIPIEKVGWKRIRNSHRTHIFSSQTEKPKKNKRFFYRVSPA